MLPCIFLYKLLRRTALQDARLLGHSNPSSWVYQGYQFGRPDQTVARLFRPFTPQAAVSSSGRFCQASSLQRPSIWSSITAARSGSDRGSCMVASISSNVKQPGPFAASFSSEASASAPMSDPPDPDPAIASQLVTSEEATHASSEHPSSPRRIFIFEVGQEALDPNWTISQPAWDTASRIQPPKGGSGKQDASVSSPSQHDEFKRLQSQRPEVPAARNEAGGTAFDATRNEQSRRVAPAAAAAAHEQAALDRDFLADTAWSHTHNAKPKYDLDLSSADPERAWPMHLLETSCHPLCSSGTSTDCICPGPSL